MIISRTMTALALGAIIAFGAACDKKSSGDTSTSSSASATSTGGAAAAGGSKRKLKTQLTSKQLEDTYNSTIKPSNDFKKHQELVTAKIGAPAKVQGDEAFWYGYQPAQGSMGDDCMQLTTSPTKGSGTQTTNGDDKCWEK